MLMLRSLRMARGLVVPLTALLFGAGGCTTAGPRILDRQTAYDPLEYEAYRGHGTAELAGLAVAKTREGEPVFGADDTVYLFPATRYTDEWWTRTMVEGRYLTDPDPRSLAYMRTTVADDGGRFRFRSLPAGEYYVVCTITWTEELVGSKARWERNTTAPPLQVANLGRRVNLVTRQRADVQLETVSRHRALIEPPSTD